ncbi:MAG TPA: DUF3455 domain-containing protein [Myxococcaceae bacterium]|jgi:hypothetical protein
MTVSRILLPCAAVLAFGCATTESAGSAASKAAVARPTVPAELEAPSSATLVVQLAARGTQNYKCQANASAAGGAEWKLVAPEAELFRSPEPGGELAGTHGAGPTWVLKDGSGAKGDGANAKKAASPESGAIPWLLIPSQSNGQPGELQGVTFVQRIGTHGGIAPPSGCDTTSVGAETKVPYTATYVFYR